jgi:16S rRNA (guanine(966)-N(2))-methyltransferase RsmD
LRVIAGHFRSRPLLGPSGTGTRPTSDRLRESLFNVLASRGGVQGLVFADLFAGSGAVGIEAISRGAQHCYFVEKAQPALTALKKNLAALGIGAAQATVLAQDVTAFLKKCPRASDVVFLDPPYEDAEAYSRVLHVLGSDAASKMMGENTLVIAEHAAVKSRKGVDDLADSYGHLHRTRLLEQSDAALSFFTLRKD